LLHTLRHHKVDIQILLCHPIQERILVSASYDGSVVFWDLITGKQLGLHKSRGNCKYLDGAFSPSGNFLALTDDIGRVSLFAWGTSPDAYARAPDVQLLPSDWMDPVFDENGHPVDPIALRPAHLIPPQQTCGLERRLHPVLTTPSFFQAPLIPEPGWMGSEAQKQQDALLRQQFESETALFAHELATCPPGYHNFAHG